MKNYHNFHKIYHKLNIKRIFSPTQTKIKFFEDPSVSSSSRINHNYFQDETNPH
jgi:hypothetical protein